MTPLRQRMLEDMQLRGLAARTQESYLALLRSLTSAKARPPRWMRAASKKRSTAPCRRSASTSQPACIAYATPGPPTCLKLWFCKVRVRPNAP
jgi:hypothetical protein